jgi:NAD(P)-dependent dehydrogenase (short-subunit alcohol dehydrogenase family)
MVGSLLVEGKRALVTGASGGLGAHFARTLSQAGASVAVAARRVADCERIAAEIATAGGTAVPVRLDVTDPASIKEAMADIMAAMGGLDILVNNAGIAATSSWFDTTPDSFDTILDTNLKGAFLVAKATAGLMRDAGKGGSIVNIASILGIGVTGQVGTYATSKAALIHMTKSMALEWARHSIRVNALCPGYIETDINRDFFASDTGAALIKRIPQRRLGRMQDLDAPLLLLASDAGSYITGTTLAVDGGHLLSPL